MEPDEEIMENHAIRFPRDLWRDAVAQAKAQDAAFSAVIRDFTAWWLRRPGAKLPKRPAVVEYVPHRATTPEPPPIVAAVITSPLGMLISKRVKADPLWGFLAGKVDPGESPAEAAVREVREEVGMVVWPAPQELSRRVHPATGKTTIYLVCTPTSSLDVEVLDTRELEEVRWVSLEDALELMPDMHEPVREYLQSEIGAK